MSEGVGKKDGTRLSYETMIKNAIIALREVPGSTFSSIQNYILTHWKGIDKNNVLMCMKRMRKNEQLLQIKYWFKLSAKELAKEYKHIDIIPIPIPLKVYTNDSIASRIKKRIVSKGNETESATATASMSSSSCEDFTSTKSCPPHSPSNHLEKKYFTRSCSNLTP